jgi:UDP:flavonoid glycosyltransferase YjiC (YdhE family)
VYLSLGSSGRSDILPSVVEALVDLPINLMVATAGPEALDIQADNLYVAPYLPGEEAASRSHVVISNGGSLTSYQALKHGVPVLGIAGNLDQHLNMSAVERFGAGIRLRTDRLQETLLRDSVSRLLEEEHYSQRAAELQQSVRGYDPIERFERILRGL